MKIMTIIILTYKIMDKLIIPQLTNQAIPLQGWIDFGVGLDGIPYNAHVRSKWGHHKIELKDSDPLIGVVAQYLNSTLQNHYIAINYCCAWY